MLLDIKIAHILQGLVESVPRQHLAICCYEKGFHLGDRNGENASILKEELWRLQCG